MTGSPRVYPGHEQEENVASFVVREHIAPGHQPCGPGDTGPAARVSRFDQTQMFWYVCQCIRYQVPYEGGSLLPFSSGLGVGRGGTAEGVSLGVGGGGLPTRGRHLRLTIFLAVHVLEPALRR